MEVATLTIAIIGAVTGVGSLAWQVVAFTAQDSRSYGEPQSSGRSRTDIG
jgi:hypothetical protein